jgi:transcriptional regulator
MYSPSYNRLEDRAELLEFMRANNFVLLVTGTGGTLHGSHLPVTTQERNQKICLDMHMARASVPTWNYAAVHAYGVPKVIHDRKLKHASQRRLIATLDPQWLPRFDALRQEYVDRMLEGIVNFEIEVTRLETRWKLSQNRSRRERERIATELEGSQDSAERSLAALTRRHLAGE